MKYIRMFRNIPQLLNNVHYSLTLSPSPIDFQWEFLLQDLACEEPIAVA
jgi:hypothetical protein